LGSQKSRDFEGSLNAIAVAEKCIAGLGEDRSMRKYLTTFLGGVLLVGGAATVHANLVITAAETGFPTTNILTVIGSPASDLSGGTSVTYGDFTINIIGAEADQSGPTELVSSSTKIKNSNFHNAGTNTLTLTVSALAIHCR